MVAAGYVTYSRSANLGLWFDPFPNTGNINDSIILESEGPMNIGGPTNSGTGPQWAVRTGNFLYLYVQDAYARDPVTDVPGFAYTVARTPLGPGVPADWRKYYRGTWTEPALGGRASALTNLTGAKMVFVEAASTWLAVDYSGGLRTSSDGLSWSVLKAQLFPARPAAQPAAAGYNASIFEYTSLIPGRGGNYLASDDVLWLYYCYVRASDPGGWAHAPRGLVAVKVNLVSLNTTNGSLGVTYLTLLQYREATAIDGGVRSTGGSLWATTLPVDSRLYSVVAPLAVVFAAPYPTPPHSGALVPLLDCVWLETGGHFLSRLGECGPVASGPGVWPALTPPAGSNTSTLTPGFFGSVGWVLPENVSAFEPLPLWRCWSTTLGYYTPVPAGGAGCAPGDEQPTLLGWAPQIGTSGSTAEKGPVAAP